MEWFKQQSTIRMSIEHTLGTVAIETINFGISSHFEEEALRLLSILASSCTEVAS